ncbi:MAG: universal stress protein [Myxococcales bacterium]|nr:universal stress protein [Myxococcales bacterium]
MQPIRKILVAVDFSAHSDHALQTAIDLAKTFGATLDVIHAFDLPIPLMTPYEVAVPDSYLNEARNAAAQKLAAAAARVAEAGVGGTSHLREVPAAPAIADTAQELGADLIVMGTRGHTGLKHIVLGSVAERTLRIAPCSVLTVKGEA